MGDLYLLNFIVYVLFGTPHDGFLYREKFCVYIEFFKKQIFGAILKTSNLKSMGKKGKHASSLPGLILKHRFLDLTSNASFFNETYI